MSYERYQILVDVPSTAPALGFEGYANALAQIITQSPPRFAVGAFGPWGSGKTTLLNAIRARLEPVKPRDSEGGREPAEDEQTTKPIICVDFSAWRYEKEEHLIIPLLDTIREELLRMAELEGESGADSPQWKKKARDAAIIVGRVLTSLIAGLSFKTELPNAFEISFEANKARHGGKSMDKKVGGRIKSQRARSSSATPTFPRASTTRATLISRARSMPWGKKARASWSLSMISIGVCREVHWKFSNP